MQILLGVLLVITGSFLAIIGILGAIGAGFQLRLLPARSVTAISRLGDKLPRPVAEGAQAPPPARVVVRGTVSAGPGGTYLAPLSGGQCAWYLATQTVADGEERSTVDRFAAQPFVLTDATGAKVLVGPVCPGLDQIPPASREVRPDPHPWFDEAPGGSGDVEVYEFTLTEGQDVLASGELSAAGDGTLRIGGEVVLSAGTTEAAAGDPAKRTLRRDLQVAFAGLALICLGALAMGLAPQIQTEPNRDRQPSVSSER